MLWSLVQELYRKMVTNQYQGLYRSKTTGIYVYFTDLTTGTCVSNAGNDRFLVGIKSDRWFPCVDKKSDDCNWTLICSGEFKEQDVPEA